MAKETVGHTTPNFTPLDNTKEAEAAAKKIPALREQEAELVEKLGEVRKEISVQSALARTTAKPGFSNAPSAKEQTAASQKAAGADATKDMSLGKNVTKK